MKTIHGSHLIVLFFALAATHACSATPDAEGESTSTLQLAMRKPIGGLACTKKDAKTCWFDQDGESDEICICRNLNLGGLHWGCGKQVGTRCERGSFCHDNNDGTVECLDDETPGAEPVGTSEPETTDGNDPDDPAAPGVVASPVIDCTGIPAGVCFCDTPTAYYCCDGTGDPSIYVGCLPGQLCVENNPGGARCR